MLSFWNLEHFLTVPVSKLSDCDDLELTCGRKVSDIDCANNYKYEQRSQISERQTLSDTVTIPHSNF